MFIIVGIITGIICVLVANHKGRNVIGWFFLGFFFGIFALIASLIVSNLKEAKEKEQHFELEQRRLREQLHQERIKTDKLRQYTQMRLDIHDRELQIDTRNIGPLLNAENKQKALDNRHGVSDSTELQESVDQAKGWYFQEGTNSTGPLSINTIKQLIQQGRILESTYVWHESLTNWTPVSKVINLNTEIDNG